LFIVHASFRSRSARRPSCTACSRTCCQSPSRPTSCCRLDPPLQPSPRVATTGALAHVH
jgi:hypothetical protein